MSSLVFWLCRLMTRKHNEATLFSFYPSDSNCHLIMLVNVSGTFYIINLHFKESYAEALAFSNPLFSSLFTSSVQLHSEMGFAITALH